MTPELQRRLSATLPPFDGKIITVCDDPTVNNVLQMLQFIASYLSDQYNDLLFCFDDWHEHDGFLTEPTVTDWQIMIDTWSDGRKLSASCHEDDDVRIGLFSPNCEWLLRYDIDSSDATTIDEAQLYVDYTASGGTKAWELIAAVAERWPKYTSVSSAASHFQSCYAG